tara:strand:+ start:7476 stop:7808 length:333 start_codon:yes stop_codon:yes gene_type:complete
MKKKKIKVNIDSTYKYIQLWNGIFNLTEKELKILASFIDVNNITEEINLCSVRNKKEVARMVGIKDYNTLNNYVKSFKDKGTMLKKGNIYTLNPFLDPDTDIVEITINKK